MKKLKKYSFSFSINKPLSSATIVARFSKEQFFRSGNKTLAKFHKDLRTSGVLVAKVNAGKVSGYIKLKEECSPNYLSTLFHLIISACENTRCFAYEDKEFNTGWSFGGDNLQFSAPKDYWKEVNNSRQSRDLEVIRLVSILKGFYLEECLHSNTTPSKQGLIEFHDSKRPYGNKDIEASIAFNLGWDWARVLCWDIKQLPVFLEKEAELLHAMVLAELQEEARSA